MVLINWKFASSAAVTASAVTLALSLALSLASGSGLALAQSAPRPAAAPPAAATSSEPDQTTANYGDWALRCVRTGEGATAVRACEILQSLSVKGQQQPLARVAIGSPEKPEALRLTLMIAPAVTVNEAPQLNLGEGTALVVTLSWRRCLPAGCFADGALTPAVLRQLKQKKEPLEMTLKDAAGKPVTLSISNKGLPQALDALAKESAPSR
jgi:invasion protein IalB